VRANARRARRESGPKPSKVLEAGPIRLDEGSMTATVNGKDVALTTYEFNLLREFVRSPRMVLTRLSLMMNAKATGDDAYDRSIDVRISRLRAKIEDDPKDPKFVKTVRGVGYRFRER
jgi:DNA-binding response OmpR family regulator